VNISVHCSVMYGDDRRAAGRLLPAEKAVLLLVPARLRHGYHTYSESCCGIERATWISMKTHSMDELKDTYWFTLQIFPYRFELLAIYTQCHHRFTAQDAQKTAFVARLSHLLRMCVAIYADRVRCSCTYGALVLRNDWHMTSRDRTSKEV
jgi:hypothetical protein